MLQLIEAVQVLEEQGITFFVRPHPAHSRTNYDAEQNSASPIPADDLALEVA